MITLTGLFLYPVKSARGIALLSATPTACGLAHDRRFMVVDAQGRFLTQRELSQLARLGVALTPDGLSLSWEGLGRHELPLAPTGGAMRRVQVWGDTLDALDLGPDVARFLTRALGVTAALVYLPEAVERVPPGDYARDTDRVAFADGFPYLVASESSLAALCARAGQAISMDRFRPNLVVAGAPAYAEDTWRELDVGEAQFELVKPCTRCVITTTDQESGERRSREPLASLAQDRLWQGQAVFGQNAVPRRLARLEVGARVCVRSLHASGA